MLRLFKQAVIALLSALLAVFFCFPTPSLATQQTPSVDYAGGDGTDTTRLTLIASDPDANLITNNQDEAHSQMKVLVPVAITYVIHSNGDIAGPSDGQAKITNYSVYSVHISNIEVAGVGGAAFTTSAPQNADEIQLFMTPGSGTQDQLGNYAVSGGAEPAVPSQWNIDAAPIPGSVGSDLELNGLTGRAASLSALNPLSKVEFGQIMWTAKVGHAQAQPVNVTYHKNDGTDDGFTDTGVAGTYAVADNMLGTRGNYTFTGWNTQADGGGTAYEVGDTSLEGGSTDLYAQWTGNVYIIRLNNHVGGAQTVIYEKYADGFYLDAACTQQMTTSSNSIPMEYRHSTPYSVYLDPNGGTFEGSTSVATKTHTGSFGGYYCTAKSTMVVVSTGRIFHNLTPTTFTQNATTELAYITQDVSYTAPVRDGYTFTGWSLEQNGEPVEGSTGTWRPQSLTTYYAQWEADNVSVDPVDFAYTGSVQTYSVPESGNYKIQTWGAEGGSGNGYAGGAGGYSEGVVSLSQGDTLYVYVGGKGEDSSNVTTHAGGFNGGGSSAQNSTTNYRGGGGGASDVRINTDSLYARVIVAGGGGGTGYYSSPLYGGAGGGVIGGNGHGSTTGGSMTSPGANHYSNTSTTAGFGGGASQISTNMAIAGGGGGWYGGGAGNGAGGGSGWVYTAENFQTWSAANSTQANSWLLSPTYYMSSAATIAGDQAFASPSGSNETGHSGNGYVRITYVRGA